MTFSTTSQGMRRLHSVYLIMSWVCDGETQRHILTVHQSQGPCGPVQTTPLPDYLARVVLSLSCLLQGMQAYIQFHPSSCAETFHLHWVLGWAPICKWCPPCCGLGRLSECVNTVLVTGPLSRVAVMSARFVFIRIITMGSSGLHITYSP